jgi:hypothetical protein
MGTFGLEVLQRVLYICDVRDAHELDPEVRQAGQGKGIRWFLTEAVSTVEVTQTTMSLYGEDRGCFDCCM